MELPFFYCPTIEPDINNLITLSEETSKHIVQVLRMQNEEQLQLTDGKGNLITASITDNNRKKCIVKIIDKKYYEINAKKISIAISPLKNNSRFEWFLEKATEIGVSEIVLLICSRTERQQIKMERLKTILISAMLQSQQCWLPKLIEPIKFEKYITTNFENTQKYIAHCNKLESKSILQQIIKPTHQLILIGPEGDFTTTEISEALKNNYLPVTLGNTRLRTETAAVVAATLLVHLK